VQAGPALCFRMKSEISGIGDLCNMAPEHIADICFYQKERDTPLV